MLNWKSHPLRIRFAKYWYEIVSTQRFSLLKCGYQASPIIIILPALSLLYFLQHEVTAVSVFSA